ncbi:hypothetical protein [Amycolatopsis sp. NPDC004079]|uniref:hypothetical protein n=1 Tax=Amycolatopsis sp. NPDC004079 TaxID=3154549 RepID=UPI0033BA85D3
MAELLDEFAKRYVDPLMKEAGFKRLRTRRWWLPSPEGNAAFVQFRAYPMDPRIAFHVEASGIPRVLREYYEGGSAVKPPKFDGGFVRTRQAAPPDRGPASHLGGHVWDFLPDTMDEYGPQAQDYLRAVAIPQWKSFLDPAGLLMAAHGGPSRDFAVVGGYGLEFSQVILRVDDGNPEVLEAMIEGLLLKRADPKLLEWLRQRVRDRAEGRR